MALIIIWSEFAETQLDEIYDYYKKKVSTKVAKKLVRGIINEPKKINKITTNWTKRRILETTRN